MTFEIDAQLRRDYFVLGKLPLSHVLLLNNAAVPWFVLVPEAAAIELCDLPDSQYDLLNAETRRLALLLRQGLPGSRPAGKLNIAAIGNIVRQLHVHVIGRFEDDPYWPGVVWGRPAERRYSDTAVHAIVRYLEEHLEDFTSCAE